MTHDLQRRLFIRELGGAALAIAVLGPLGACATTKTQTTLLPPATAGAPATTTLVATSTTQTTLLSPATTGAPATTAPVATTPSCTRVLPVIAGTSVERIKSAESGTNNFDVSSYLMVRGTEVALVDTGYWNSEDNIEAALSTVGLGWDNVGHIILTHSHPDHRGSLRAAMELATEAVAYAGGAAIPAIPTSPRSITPLLDGDSVFGLNIINTPGHTTGHISVHDPQGRTLIAGDALDGQGGGVATVQGVGAPAYYQDIEKVVASAKKMALLDFDTLYFGHGEPVLSCADEALRAYVATL